MRRRQGDIFLGSTAYGAPITLIRWFAGEFQTANGRVYGFEVERKSEPRCICDDGGRYRSWQGHFLRCPKFGR